jgi:hypothetical protein
MNRTGIPRHTLTRTLVATVIAVVAACSRDEPLTEHADGGGAPGAAADASADGGAGGGAADAAALERTIWHADSVAIDIQLTGPIGQNLCEFSATRAALSQAQLDGLSALRPVDSSLTSGCDLFSYTITVQAQGGASKSFQATQPGCSSAPILRFEDFEAWASSTPCSQAHHA